MNIKRFLLNYIYAQLLVTIVALPILIHWGLQISMVSFIANLIFAPVFSLAFIISSIMFFTELLGIPNGYIALCYDYLIQAWDFILRCGSKKLLVGWVHPGRLVLLAIPVITFMLLRHKKINSRNRRIVAMSFIIVCSTVVLWRIQVYKINQYQPVHDEEKFSALLDEQKKLSFVDDGFFNSKGSPDKAVEFELKPYLIKKYGCGTIKELVLLRPGQRSFIGALAFCQIFNVKKVTFPYFDAELSRRGWRSFFDLTRFVQDNGIALSRIIDIDL